MRSGRGTSRHIDATRSPRGVEQGTDVGRCISAAPDARRFDEHQGKMRRDNCQWQQPTVTAYRSPAPLRPCERVFMIAGTGVHDQLDWPFTITGMRTELARMQPDHQVADRLNAEGLRTRTGKNWTYARVHSMRKQHDIPTGCPLVP